MLVAVRVDDRLIRLRRFKGSNSLWVGPPHAVAINGAWNHCGPSLGLCGTSIWPHILRLIVNEQRCGEPSWERKRLANPRGRYYGINRQIQLQ